MDFSAGASGAVYIEEASGTSVSCCAAVATSEADVANAVEPAACGA